jgi:hypothetical protein
MLVSWATQSQHSIMRSTQHHTIFLGISSTCTNPAMVSWYQPLVKGLAHNVYAFFGRSNWRSLCLSLQNVLCIYFLTRSLQIICFQTVGIIGCVSGSSKRVWRLDTTRRLEFHVGPSGALLYSVLQPPLLRTASGLIALGGGLQGIRPGSNRFSMHCLLLRLPWPIAKLRISPKAAVLRGFFQGTFQLAGISQSFPCWPCGSGTIFQR